MLNKPYKINTTVRLIELFGGVGAQAMSLKELNVPFEHYRYIEWDKFPVASYNAIHNTSFESTDVTKITGDDLGIVEKDKYTYILTYSFPCISLSLAGKREGMVKGSGTASSLLWEVERLLTETKELPQILIMENVTQVHSKTVNKKTGKSNLDYFNEWINFLSSLGYNSYYADMNAKDFGVPQNRVRTIMVSILGDYTFSFPEGFTLTKHLKDYLDTKVEDKYYLTSDKTKKLVDNLLKEGRLTNNQFGVIGSTQKNAFVGDGEYSPTLTSAMGMGGGQIPMLNEEYIMKKDEKVIIDDLYPSRTRVFPNYSPALRAERHDLKVADTSVIVAMRGRNPNNPSDRTTGCPTVQRLEPQHEGICNTITTVQKDNLVLEFNENPNLRKMTPRECWRLMDFTDEDFNKAAAVNSNTQLYKEAGNSIVKNILVAVIGQLFEGKENHYKERFD